MEQIKTHLIRLMGFKKGELPTKYLGNVLDYSSKRMKNWQGIIDKLNNRIANWAFRCLNIAGRIVLVKSVLQAIPIYSLSIMAAPSGIYTKLREIMRRFIWGGTEQRKKWALASWKTLTKRKESGRLGLRDPEKINRVLGAKLWWRWMGGGSDIWKTIWTRKYNMPQTPEEILRIDETPKGSTIWDLARQNRDIIVKHAFWEIQGGEVANFWNEKWNQKIRLNSIPAIQQIQERLNRNGQTVSEYWEAEEVDGIWRKWKNPRNWDKDLSVEQVEAYLKEMNSRKIKARIGKDILRWGNSAKGTYMIKEAYYLIDNPEPNEENQEWMTIWKNHWWPKISIFTWFTSKNKILTWDRIQKKGFHGPSSCHLCKKEEENRDHLFVACPFIKELWSNTKRLFGKADQMPGDIKTIILQWHKDKFQSRVVGRAWILIA